ncbi:MAG: ABC transporter permease subunit [Myxococcales bacterium]|nr:ABC transporter permease subunit [Myxococcales bacterium]
MQKIWIIGKREFMSYFSSPIAYIAITVFLVLTGLQFFFGWLTIDPYASATDYFEANEASLRVLFEGVPLLFVVFLPAITMRLMSDEKRSGTMELLITLPVRDHEVILGKFLAALMFLIVALALTLPYVVTVYMLGNPDTGPIIGGYFGLLLVGACYCAIGLMTSTWTKNQIVAFLLGVLICAGFYFVDTLIGAAWESTRETLHLISFKYHFQNISRGIIDSRDLVFFLSLIVLAVLLSTYSLQSRKWKA